MEIFRFLSDIKNAEVTTNVVREDVYPELNGTIILSKGIFKADDETVLFEIKNTDREVKAMFDKLVENSKARNEKTKVEA